MIPPVVVPVWMEEILQGHTLRLRAIGNKWLLKEGGSISFRINMSERLFNPKWSSTSI